MPNRNDVLPDLPDITAEEVARCIQQWITEDERSYAWLARKIGVGDTRTLRSWLEDRPDLLPVEAWLSSLVALGRTGADVRTAVAALRARSPEPRGEVGYPSPQSAPLGITEAVA